VTYTNFLQLFDRLQYRYLVCRVRQLGRQRRAQTGQAGADDDEVYTLVCVTLFTHGGVVDAVDLLTMPRFVDRVIDPSISGPWISFLRKQMNKILSPQGLRLPETGSCHDKFRV
jgi:hypothetical protein